jgi:hypothetical protein
MAWHGALVVADRNSVLGGSPAQYSHVIKTIELGVLRSFKVDTRFLTKCCGHNEPIKVVVGLIADGHEGLAICSRAR